MSSRGSVGSRREKPRRWGDTAPWRRKINAAVGKPPTTMASHSEGTLSWALPTKRKIGFIYY